MSHHRWIPSFDQMDRWQSFAQIEEHSKLAVLMNVVRDRLERVDRQTGE